MANAPEFNITDIKYNMKFLWLICLVAAMGGLLFGYDWVVIGGAKAFYEPYFNISDNTPFMRGWAMSSALFGCIFGAIVSGMAADRYGRKPLLILAGLLFTVSAVMTGLAWDFSSFITARIIGGLGIGLASNLSPMFIAEISPAHIRGRFVSINQLTIVIGILAAQVVNLLIARPISPQTTAEVICQSWNGQYGWRWMFAAETVPAFLFFILMFYIPESPRWLVKYGKHEPARKTLTRIGGPTYANTEIEAIRRTISDEEVARVNYKDLLAPELSRVILLGIFLAVFQQWCGINVIFNYAQEVFAASGYGVSDIMFNIVVTGIVNLIFTFVAIFTVDKLGRRPLMLIGSAGLAGIYALMGIGYYFQSSGMHMLILVILAIACYAMTLAPITWVVISEIYPNRIRGAAMSLAVLSLWLACTVLTLTFPYMNKKLGAHGSFGIFSLICIAGLVVVARSLPETKGRSLEQIEQEM